MNGSEIKQWRIAERIKQSTLAQMLGVSQTTISKWESGAWIPSRAMALRLADAIYSPHVGRLKLGSGPVNLLVFFVAV